MEQANSELVNFILEARRRGFGDVQIKEPLLKHNWPPNLINEAFASLKKRSKRTCSDYSVKNLVTVYLSTDVLKAIDKRAKQNMHTLPEQIEDILRRSCVNSKKMKSDSDKLDDMFVGLFSRKKRAEKKAA